MEQLLASPPLRPLGLRVVERMARASFPHNLGLALDAVLAAAAADGLHEAWHQIFEKLPFDRLELRQAARLLHTLTSHLPLPAHYLHGATRLAHLLLLSSPHMPAELADELQQLEDEAPRDGAGTLWAEFVAFFVGALQPSGGAEVTDEAFGELLGLLCQVETAPSL